MKRQINKVAVLGAGVMGATIAAHLTNTGVQVVMLDIVPSEPNDAEKAAGLTTADKKVRNRYAADGLAGLLKMKPAPFLLKSYASYITVGNLEDDIELLKDCDWVMECVIENMQIKENLFKNKIVPNFKPGAILSTNTSGLSINALAKTLPPEIAKNFLVTHYFNPPRYMRLMELVACDQTDPETFAFMADWLNVRQGKGIVYGKDTPNFISNRIGTYAGANAGMYMEKLDFTVEEVDLLTGSVIARPKMASFALGDLVGVDTIERIYDNTYRLLEGIDEDRDVFVVSNCVREMVKKGLTGNKVKKGYYKKEKVEGKNVKFVLNWKTVEYEPCVKPTFESVTAAMAGKTPAERLGKFIREGNDRAAEFGWKNVRDTMIYAAKRIPEISNDVINIDNAMKWGYNWELGPFECLDAIGVPYFVERCEKDGVSFPAYLKDVKAFYAVVDGKDCYYDIPTKKYVAIPMADTNVSLTVLKRGNKTVGGNEAASVIDLGDGVFCVEYHTKSNAISPEVLTVINQGIAIAEKEGKALVLANNGPMFSAGADLSQLAKGIEAGAWDQLLAGVKSFQDAMMNIKYSKIPVVAAPHQMALGGGCESCIHADAIVPHAETYMGLVEIGVGLLPGGGGTKEMALRAIKAAAKADTDVQPFIMKNFQNIAMAKVSMSAAELYNLGYLAETDQITMEIDKRIYDAKKLALALAENYRPSMPAINLKAPGRGIAGTLRAGLFNMMKGGYVSEHDAFLAAGIGDVLCGGDVPSNTIITEEYLLELEREMFVRFARTEKTQARILHMLKKGAPLRN